MTQANDNPKHGATPAPASPAIAQDNEKSHLAELSEHESQRVHGRQIDNQNHETQGRQTPPRELQNRRNIGRGPQ